MAHLVDSMPDYTDDGRIDGKNVPPFHFGLVMEWNDWNDFRDKLIKRNFEFRIKPHIRYPGKVGEQATLFLNDPSGNAIEFKSFRDDERLFATSKGGENEIGGGVLD